MYPNTEVITTMATGFQFIFADTFARLVKLVNYRTLGGKHGPIQRNINNP
jgi:hypothetical protein